MKKCVYCNSQIKAVKKFEKYFFCSCSTCYLTYPFALSKEEAWQKVDDLNKYKDALEFYSKESNWKNLNGSPFFVCEKTTDVYDKGDLAREVLGVKQ